MNVCSRHSPEESRFITNGSVLSHANTPGDVGGHPAMMADVEEVEVVVAHSERATLRVGDVFLKIDSDQTRTDVEVGAMAMAPVPTPEILWRKPPVLALRSASGDSPKTVSRLAIPTKSRRRYSPSSVKPRHRGASSPERTRSRWRNETSTNCKNRSNRTANCQPR